MAKRTHEQESDFEDVMRLTKADVKAPLCYPEGPWNIRNVGFTASDVTDEQHGDQRMFNLRYEGVEPDESVDPDAIEAGGFEGKTLWVKRYISRPAAKASRDGSLSRFIRFVELHGVNTDDLDLDDMCKALKGQMIHAELGTRSYTSREGDLITDNTVSNLAAIAE